MKDTVDDSLAFMEEINAAVDRTMRARSMVESLILSRKMYLPDPNDPNVTIEELRKRMDPLVEREARTVILGGNLEECVDTFIACYDYMAAGDWARNGKQGERPHVEREELEWDRQTLDDLFLVQYVEWMVKVGKRIDIEKPNAKLANLNPEALAEYDEIVRETPVPGISNEELAAMVKPEETAEAYEYILARSKRIKELVDCGLLKLEPANR